MAKNKVKFGLSNVHIAKITVNESGKITYGTPFKIPGAVNLSFDPEGDNEAFYADNIKYFESYANNGYSGDLEIADIPDQFLNEILGQRIDSAGGVVENINDKTSAFAFMYQIEGDQSGTRFCYYNATVSRPSSEASTIEDTKTPNTDTLTITTSARETDGQVRYKLPLSTTNKTKYDSFFDSVPEPEEDDEV